MSTRWTAPLRRALLVAVPVLLLAGCSGPERGSLDAQPATPSPPCLVHQSREPAERYTAGRDADTAAVLEMMRYFTAHGSAPYCDGKPPTATDLAWRRLYTGLGGDPAKVPLR
ncbi:hypothetical protein ACIQBJ_00650 [Kitasatospora sp. NPDC088391]|uniref:hypothetical protein n=1 Tax=Kitasatospora sp. NPDC088391 TaxID=3364074 RepID=UPI00380ACD64